MVTYAIILAGGRSSRVHRSAPNMVPDKPFLQRMDGGERLIDVALRATAGCARRVVVGPAMDLPAGVRRVREAPPQSGPASAIAAGLATLGGGPEDSVLILAADMPTPEVAGLLEAELHGDGLIAVAGGYPQPLLCRLRLDAARTAFDGVRGGSVKRCLDGLDLREIALGDDAARDVDTWDDAMHAGFGVVPGAARWVVARQRVYDAGRRIGLHRAEEHVPAVGLRLAQPVCTPIPVPHYSSSAMDGFAVAGPGPWRLLEPAATGAQGRNIHRESGRLRPGKALPILTGSVLPDGTEAIVRAEHARVVGEGMELLDGHAISPGADVRHAGEELAQGDVIIEAGTVLHARHLPLLAACGVDSVVADRPLTVDCAFTGNEVITSGIPGPGEVRDAFSSSFPALISEMGARVGRMDRLPDSPDEVREWLASSTADVVLVTGGSGRSGQDFARTCITELADEILADSIQCQPGHPTLIASRDVRGRLQLIIGVPGNPLAAHVAVHSFAAPAFAGARGLGFPAVRTCTLDGEFHALHRDRVRLIPASLGGGRATPMANTNSHMLSGYAHADCLLVIDPAGAKAGDLVNYLPLHQG